jgi:uncharacterized membrane protein YjfL (UPF0719 family)
MSDQMVAVICGVVHLVLSFLLALIGTFGSFRIFDWLTKDIDEVSELRANNIAVAITLAGMLLGAGLVLRSVVYPVISTVQTYLYTGMTGMAWLKLTGFVAGYIVCAVAVTIGAIWIALKSFLALTHKIDEFAEIRNRNIAVAIVLAAVVVIISMFLGDGVRSLLEASIPYPVMQPIEVMGS